MEREPTTREAFEKLRDQIRYLENEEMPKIAVRIAEARAEGDLSENAEYHGQREEQGRMQARINMLKAKLANCYIVETSNMPKGIVTFGSRVTIRDTKDGSEETYEFVGPGGEDYSGEVMKILTSSPLAKSLMGKKAGEQVELQLPRGMQNLEIVKVHDED